MLHVAKVTQTKTKKLWFHTLLLVVVGVGKFLRKISELQPTLNLAISHKPNNTIQYEI
jgi:hypothetical protein